MENMTPSSDPDMSPDANMKLGRLGWDVDESQPLPSWYSEDYTDAQRVEFQEALCRYFFYTDKARDLRNQYPIDLMLAAMRPLKPDLNLSELMRRMKGLRFLGIDV